MTDLPTGRNRCRSSAIRRHALPKPAKAALGDWRGWPPRGVGTRGEKGGHRSRSDEPAVGQRDARRAHGLARQDGRVRVPASSAATAGWSVAQAGVARRPSSCSPGKTRAVFENPRHDSRAAHRVRFLGRGWLKASIGFTKGGSPAASSSARGRTGRWSGRAQHNRPSVACRGHNSGRPNQPSIMGALPTARHRHASFYPARGSHSIP